MSDRSAKDLRRQMTGSESLPKPLSGDDLSKLKEKNNPDNKPVWPDAERCPKCGSDDLWSDELAMGCDLCGWLAQEEEAE